ncbi:acyltransferase family protein [Paenibacillus lautus]|uniref:acyltransferase family protein n=1 Tax=Paenibacillus lautus TaxID=1401 RepID=UPI003D297181
MSDKRIDWIDVLKGLAIILVVLGHSPALHVRTYIFSFHMPLFFFISGYLFSIIKYDNMFQFIKRKSLTILVPYVAFALISIVSLSVLHDANLTIKEYAFDFINSTRNQIPFNEALWFLTALFVIEVVYYLGLRFIKNKYILLFICIAISFTVYFFKNGMAEPPSLPWSLDQAFYYLIFFSIGNTFRDFRIDKSVLNFIISIGIALNILFLIKPQFIGSAINLIPNSIYSFFASTLVAIIGIVAFIGISKVFADSKKLQLIGENSLIIFALHLPLAFVIVDKLVIMLNLNLQPNNFGGIMYSLLTLVILSPVVYVINRYTPFIVGRKQNHKQDVILKDKYDVTA